MIVASGMNALARRSCVCIPVRTFATAAKSGGSGSGTKNRPRYKGKRPGDKPKPQSKAQAQTASAAVPKPTSTPTPTFKPAPAPAPAPAPKFVSKPTSKSAPKSTPKSAPKPKPEPEPEPEPAPAQSVASFHESLNATTRGPHIPLPTPNPPLSSYTLTPDKLRALIDLYHSSTKYITPETLSSAIDQTFAPLRFNFNTGARFTSYRDLVAERDELDAEPDRVVPSANDLGGRGFGTADSIGGALAAGGWSPSKAERARMVKAALWGVDPMAKIGLETLLEAKVELDAQEKEQKE
ncbi:hypothetical protein BN14_00969 [Rhizoctonia solani AG-1 IB]|uniref:Uncharacterized protein n=1 Tax=Thanatephorus cucumeris (strain AG1-IB / isolate 7/3/14) TaxID=1108050 RepID=M5BT81_THACB|nr:hypothetical protein BN14_00969 [Rhizoctonia solani AG-1 IB]